MQLVKERHQTGIADLTYRNALGLEDSRKWSSAYTLYKQLLEKSPASAELNFRAGFCLLQSKDWIGAEVHFRKAIQADASLAEHFNKLAQALHHQGKPEAEMEALQAAIQLDSRHASWHFRLAEVMITLQRWSDAEQSLKNAISRKDTVAQYHGSLAFVLQKQGRLKEEIDALTIALSLEDSNLDWEVRLKSAQEELEAPLKAESICKIALDQISSEQWSEAETNLLYAISLNKSVPEYHVHLAQVYKNEKNYKKEIASLEQAVALDPENNAYLELLRDAQTSQEQLFRSKADKLHALGNAALEVEMWKDAEKAFQKAIKLCDDVAEYHLSLAVSLKEQRRVQDEINSLRQAIELGADSADLYCRLGNACISENQLDAAATAFENAIALDPNVQEYYDKYAGILNKIGDRLQESRILETVVGLKQNYRAFGFRLTDAYVSTNQWPDAKHALLKTIEQDSLIAEYYSLLATIYRALDERVNEVDALQIAVSLDHGQASWFFRLGEAAEAIGNFELASHGYSNATSLADNDPSWHYRLGYAWHRQGRDDLAAQAFNKVLERAASPESRALGIATFHETYGNLDLAIAAYNEEIQKNSDDAELHYRLANVYERNHNWNDAAIEYKRAIELDGTKIEWYCRLDFVLSRLVVSAQPTKAKSTSAKKRPAVKASVLQASHAKQYINEIVTDEATRDQLRFDSAKHFFQLGLNELASDLLGSIRNPGPEALLLDAKIDLYASRFDAVEHKTLRGMSKLSSKADAEAFREAYYLWIEALQRQSKLTDVHYALQNPPFPTRNNQYFKALRRSIRSLDHLNVYRQCVVHFPKNVGGHDACLFNYSILLRDLGLHSQSHDIARDRLNKNLGRLDLGSKKVVRKESWVSDAEIALHDLKQALDKYGIEFFLVSGTLLGCVREKGIIGHDKDIDVGFDERYSVDLVRECMTNSPHFTLFDVPFERNVYVQHSNGVAIDIFRHYMDDGKYYHEGIKVKWWNSPFTLKPVEFLGGEYLIPADFDTYLTENYGNWRVPVSEFETFVDTPNMEVVDTDQLIWYYITKMNDYYLEGKIPQLRRVISAYSKLVDDPSLNEGSFNLTASA